MRGTLILGLTLGLFIGCGDDDGTSAPGPDAMVEADAGAMDAGPSDAGNADASTGGCTSDDDCRRFSSTCDGCECLPLLESEPDPVCEGTMVSCLVDPCESAGAVRCDTATGTCELE